MQLVGATSGFIQRPFLLRASAYGLIAGLFSSGLLAGLLYFANMKIEGLRDLQSDDKLMMLAGLLLFLGLIVGFMSTFAAIKRYSKLSLDELY